MLKPGSQLRILNHVGRLIIQPRLVKPWLVVVVTPASGQASPNLRMLNRLIQASGYHWEMYALTTACSMFLSSAGPIWLDDFAVSQRDG